MISRFSAGRAPRLAPRAPRKGLSLVEVIVAVMVLSIAMAFVGHISSSLAQYNRVSDVVAKRTFAMQQQANIIGAMPFGSLTAALLPATKTFPLDDRHCNQRSDDAADHHDRAADRHRRRHAPEGVARDGPHKPQLRHHPRHVDLLNEFI
jgi:prepilin-type N-terminal cleavage/methylation domain-containing protein